MKSTKQQDLTNWCFTPFGPNFCCSEVKNQAVLSALASNQHHRNLYFSWKWDLSRGCVRSQNCGSLKMSKQARQKLYPPKTDLVLLRITIINSTNSRATKNLKKTILEQMVCQMNNLQHLWGHLFWYVCTVNFQYNLCIDSVMKKP